ncbi:MAG TPA: DNA-3-methyladenine glycosylase 2 family protein [Candidatus Methylomirabilis sp.]|nr:DNA-3-methyladenine glycosylase 2 family protein [Candidatus Methylomirabilis sp.]
MKPLTKESLAGAAQHLAKRDRELAEILDRYGPPPLWGRTPGFPTLVQIILEQQVSLASARSVFRRLTTTVAPFTAIRFIELGEPYFRSLGITRQKAAYCLHVARAVAEGHLRFAVVARASDAAARAALTQITGIGPWTADIYLLMALRRADVWPSGDLALVKAASTLKKLRGHPTPIAIADIAEGWRPFRSVAARMLWQYYLAGGG